MLEDPASTSAPPDCSVLFRTVAANVYPAILPAPVAISIVPHAHRALVVICSIAQLAPT